MATLPFALSIIYVIFMRQLLELIEQMHLPQQNLTNVDNFSKRWKTYLQNKFKKKLKVIYNLLKYCQTFTY